MFKSITVLVASLVLAAPAQADSQFNIATTGQFTDVLLDDLHDPGAPNQLADWLGQGFTVQMAWSASAVQRVDPVHVEFDRAWQLLGNGSISVGASFAASSTLNYLGKTNNWFYDGSLGILPAGHYDQFTLFGMTVACSGDSCNTPPGTPPRYEWSIDLIGSPGMLPLGNALPTVGDIQLDKVLLVETIVTKYDGGLLVGGVESRDTSPTRLDRLSLTVSPVPEPSTAVLALLGLAGLGLWRRRASALSPRG